MGAEASILLRLRIGRIMKFFWMDLRISLGRLRVGSPPLPVSCQSHVKCLLRNESIERGSSSYPELSGRNQKGEVCNQMMLFSCEPPPA